MSIGTCEKCGEFIDTDAYPEKYREEFPDEKYPNIPTLLCDECYELRLGLKEAQ